MIFSKKLKLLAGRHRYSQATLAQRVGVSQNLVSLWMRGMSVPDLPTSAKIAKLFDVDLGYLADDAQDDPPASEFSESERALIELVRAMGLDRREATRRLTTSGNQGYVRTPEVGPFPAAGPEYPNESPQSGRGTPRKKLPG